MAATHDLHDEVVKVHAAFESASKQLAQHPTFGLFFINDHVKTSIPGVLQKLHLLQQQQRLCKLSQHQAEDAEATVRDLKSLVACLHQQYTRVAVQAQGTMSPSSHSCYQSAG
ncbi:hypothetical protein WJX77_011652 [Trebouxia sp. C0004]